MKKSLRKATQQELKRWNELISENPFASEVYQTKEFAEIKKGQGWQPEFWVYQTASGNVFALALTRNVIGVGRIVYIPRGPSVIEPKQWSEICTINRRELTDVVLVKMEPPILRSDLKLLRDDCVHTADIQRSVINTVVIDLDRSEDELWESFRQRARRAVRGGKREQLIVSEAIYSDQNADHMWNLYKETADRAGLRVRPKEYFLGFWKNYIDNDMGRFFFVWEQGNNVPVAGLFVCFTGERALYKDGGSRRDTKAHFSHLLQWQTMLYLQTRGVKYYDLGGTPPSDKLDDPTQRLASLATFKMSFGAPVTDYIGAYDQILKPAAYKRWRIYEKVVRRLKSRLPSRDIY